MRRRAILWCIILLGVLFTSCSHKDNEGVDLPKDDKVEDDNHPLSNDIQSVNNRKFSVWTTYWDIDTIYAEVEYMKDNIENISYFAAYFDKDKKPFIPQNTNETYNHITKAYEENTFGSYLTFVNDVMKADGTSSLKDTKILYTLFSTEEARENHIDEIISLAERAGYDGIEIDYEAIKKDIKLWKLYNQFIDKLYEKTLEKDIPLRIVLEPGTPIDKLTLPEGPEYVVMCYNLYGYGTKPGPKANREFLLEMVEKMTKLPGKVNFAVAAGGFDFAENGSVGQVTETKAEQIKQDYNASTYRDEESQCLVFTYIDKEKVSHEVWYADNSTIQYWFDIIKNAGDYGLSLWRLGGIEINN
ncbi:glycosyl hydrolase family 18 protein [Lachnoclostridium phytofermentans]|uniref:GH18 domain-containing protein n=1 Tax=Lachnoclostridium phytofermentans (strain ATCC 700394 / DSM 18823 / ISDg) TaxID=357809 RepID=A9KK04_LACP7|nr:glycosyl hydrolase family 18 protein [Lachnoclostridium phytofermentans]ABX42576.1 conserved hypothetical protein [Lachnoclostridium phytofermentans ISDg]